MAKRKDIRPDVILREIGAGGTAAAVNRILSYWHRATMADGIAGAEWYGTDAMTLLLSIVMAARAAGHRWFTIVHAAVVLSHLSPRTTWQRNVAGAIALVTEGYDACVSDIGCMKDNARRAARAMDSEDPMGTFGKNAHKTRSFARNLLGDRHAVTVDVWALRIAMPDGMADEKILKRVGTYDAIAHAYRLAAARVGVDPTTMQATTWIVARNGRAG